MSDAMSSVSRDPSRKAGNRRNHRMLQSVAAASALVLAACTAGTHHETSVRGKTKAPITVPATVPETTTTTVNPEKANNTYNQEVAKKIANSVRSRMEDLPERILAYGQRHGMSHHIYEIGVPGTNTGVDNSNDLDHLVQGTNKNILVQSRMVDVAGDKTLGFSFLMSWHFDQDGSRKPDFISFFNFDHTDPNTFSNPELRGFNTHNRVDINFDAKGGLSVGYDDVASGTNQGEAASVGPTGERTTVDPTVVEDLLLYFDDVTRG